MAQIGTCQYRYNLISTKYAGSPMVLVQKLQSFNQETLDEFLYPSFQSTILHKFIFFKNEIFSSFF